LKGHYQEEEKEMVLGVEEEERGKEVIPQNVKYR